METYRLSSKLVENNKEYIIQTINDVSQGTVSSEVFVDGMLTDSVKLPHPEQIKPEEVLSLVKSTHDDKKKEMEVLLKAYRQALDSANPEMMFHLGQAFLHKRFFAEACELFRNAVALNPDYHEAYNLLGQAHLTMGDIDNALQAALKAVTMRPEYADYRNSLGEVFLASKDFKKAVTEFDRAMAINLYYGDAYFNSGLALILNAIHNASTELFANFVSKSTDYFNKASLIYPAYRTSAFEKGLEALKAHDLKKAFELLKKVRETKKEFHRRRYASYYMKYALFPTTVNEKVIQERIDFLNNEISKNPTYVDLYVELSHCYLEQSRLLWKKGIEQYRKSLEINPALTRLTAYIEDAEKAYEEICRVTKGTGNI